MISCVVFLPIIGAMISGLLCRKINDHLSQLITSICTLTAALLSGFIFVDVVINKHNYVFELLQWFDIDNLNISWALKVDSLTAIMLVVVTSVSTLVHIYSIGYMHDDPHKPRFMAYLSLFTFFMLILVTANNLLQLFVGWEGVGLCSYLLIGFWYKKESANNAAMKAFIVNRVGDFAFALGLLTIFVVFNSLSFDKIFADAASYQDVNIELLGFNIPALNLICILLFVGSMGKSAQIGLHTWLPDAMEGPTPVSALIHAATMVTAGVFLVARCSPLFEYSQLALNIITVVGAVTCLFAASIAVTQNDIKKIIAYSTCSQLGYMFFACGVSAYSAAMFHLMTHAFFKALLFLGAGSVIHAMSGEQNINKMGAIAKKIPFTCIMMWIGSFALAGFYPLAGYYSKDAILEAAYASGSDLGKFAYFMGITAAFLTAFYSWRLLFRVFHGKPNYDLEHAEHIHESPISMTFPLLILSIGAVFAGMLGDKLGILEEVTQFWGNAIVILDSHTALADRHHVAEIIKQIPMIAGVVAIVLAYIFYLLFPNIPLRLAKLSGFLYKLSLNKYYFDEIYNFLFVQPARCLGNILWQSFDINIIDNLGPNLTAKLSKSFSNLIARGQTGYLYHYALVVLAALIGLMSWYIFNIVN